MQNFPFPLPLRSTAAFVLLFTTACGGGGGAASSRPTAATDTRPMPVPLPEHPRPDFKRADWLNLNGAWGFRFDTSDEGVRGRWYLRPDLFDQRIRVPFSWAAPLSGVADKAPQGERGHIGWYARMIEVPPAWQGRRVHLVIGASDWKTTAWLDGRELGSHEGGYLPIDFDLGTRTGKQLLVIRVDDDPRPWKLEGKQGYGQARGIWQTVYLEARGSLPVQGLRLLPDLANGKVKVEATLAMAAPTPAKLTIDIEGSALESLSHDIKAGDKDVSLEVPLPNARLWTLQDPHLYPVTVRVHGAGLAEDKVESYFGMRSISVVDLPGTKHPYIALNGEPIYLQLALDQAYHPEGFYTFPTDEFMRDEILRARRIGLNGIRVHIKAELPRKLYWADRLGVLVMADVPNSWGPPDAEMRAEAEATMRGQIARDFNHPSIFSWVVFNETWGLTHADGDDKVYRKETQEWVESQWQLAKSLDPTRLVEDNSPNKFDHVATDINSWHSYEPGWKWEELLTKIEADTHPGSAWNFVAGKTQGRQPNINSEFGNVWGYEGSTGDVDYSWDYHEAVNAFRRHPKIAGWLYTEHHDVINEWNGYYRFDRSDKITGMDELVAGMTLADLHSPLFIAPGGLLSADAQPGSTVKLPLFASFLANRPDLGASLRLATTVYFWNTLGERSTVFSNERLVEHAPWKVGPLPPLSVPMPNEPGVALVALRLLGPAGEILHRNFTTFVVQGSAPVRRKSAEGLMQRILRQPAAAFTGATWSERQWNVLDGVKVNGAGHGHFEYQFTWPADVRLDNVDNVAFIVEASAKQLFSKDREGAGSTKAPDGSYMRGRGLHDPARNPNAYPMTDTVKYPSAVTVFAGGVPAGRFELEDDPADHRGILSWHNQKRDKHLHEAGSYGQRLVVTVPKAALATAAKDGKLTVRLAVDEALPGGLAIYGAKFGRYPIDPTLVITERRR